MAVRKQTAPKKTSSGTATQPATRRSAKAPIAPPGGRYIGRDESWLQFNRRVLEEADDASNPLLERVKFLAISASNLDEFVEIRIAGVLQQLEEGLGLPHPLDPGGLTQEQRMEHVRDRLHEFI